MISVALNENHIKPLKTKKNVEQGGGLSFLMLMKLTYLNIVSKIDVPSIEITMT